MYNTNDIKKHLELLEKLIEVPLELNIQNERDYINFIDNPEYYTSDNEIIEKINSLKEYMNLKEGIYNV